MLRDEREVVSKLGPNVGFMWSREKKKGEARGYNAVAPSLPSFPVLEATGLAGGRG